MWLSDSYICSSIRQAKDQKKQLSVLSELNACKVSDIISVLKANNFEWKDDQWVEKEILKPALSEKSKESFGTVVEAEGMLKSNIKVSISSGRNDVMTRKIVSAETKEAILKDYLKTGETYSTIANRFGVSTWLVGEIVRKYREEEKKAAKPVVSEIPEENKDLVRSIEKGNSAPDFSWLANLDVKALNTIFNSLDKAITDKTFELKNLFKAKSYVKDLLNKK